MHSVLSITKTLFLILKNVLQHKNSLLMTIYYIGTYNNHFSFFLFHCSDVHDSVVMSHSHNRDKVIVSSFLLYR